MLCDSCGEHPATILITQAVDGQMTKLHLCEECVRRQAAEGDWPHEFDAMRAPLEDVVRELFGQIPEHEELDDIESRTPGEIQLNEIFFEVSAEFPSDEDLTDEMDEGFDEPRAHENNHETDEETALNNLLGDTSGLHAFFDDKPGELRDLAAKRCPKCSITWDRLKQDGRAGCAQCYETFAEQLREVMERVQSASHHTGKRPRAADKRRRRLEQLRAKRDNRLEMLNRRLQEAIQEERFEEAAKLRDQIRIVSSTIVAQPE
jgi:protein arginine kinase activator